MPLSLTIQRYPSRAWLHAPECVLLGPRTPVCGLGQLLMWLNPDAQARKLIALYDHNHSRRPSCSVKRLASPPATGILCRCTAQSIQGSVNRLGTLGRFKMRALTSLRLSLVQCWPHSSDIRGTIPWRSTYEYFWTRRDRIRHCPDKNAMKRKRQGSETGAEVIVRALLTQALEALAGSVRLCAPNLCLTARRHLAWTHRPSCRSVSTAPRAATCYRPTPARWARPSTRAMFPCASSMPRC